jgi:hypothetical protein
MTKNQTRAVSLARALLEQRLHAVDLADADWHLLLMAADVYSPLSLPLVVAHRVVQHWSQKRGYFMSRKVSDRMPATVHGSC